MLDRLGNLEEQVLHDGPTVFLLIELTPSAEPEHPQSHLNTIFI
jgi:hypothetical protein